MRSGCDSCEAVDTSLQPSRPPFLCEKADEESPKAPLALTPCIQPGGPATGWDTELGWSQRQGPKGWWKRAKEKSLPNPKTPGLGSPATPVTCHSPQGPQGEQDSESKLHAKKQPNAVSRSSSLDPDWETLSTL